MKLNKKQNRIIQFIFRNPNNDKNVDKSERIREEIKDETALIADY